MSSAKSWKSLQHSDGGSPRACPMLVWGCTDRPHCVIRDAQECRRPKRMQVQNAVIHQAVAG